jgi:PTS system fructose-specific IIC component
VKDSDSMVLTKYITKQCIVPTMKATTKADAIKELTNLLFEKRKLDGVSSALEQIVAREVTESTGIGKGIAVPHARITGMKSLACSVGRVPGGLDFKAVDRKPTHLIFLICYPPVDQTTYLNFVATVARLLSDSEHLKAMLDAKTADNMHEVLEATSQSFTENHEARLRKLKADPAIAKTVDGNTNLILLARLQLCHEMLQTTKSGKAQITKRIEAIRSLVEPRVLTHFDKLMKSYRPALVSVEGDTCQGCFIKLPSKFVQQVRQDPVHIHTCLNCSRFIYVV